MRQNLSLYSTLMLLAMIAIGCGGRTPVPPAYTIYADVLEPRVANDGLTDEWYFNLYKHMEWNEMGRSVEGRPILWTEFGEGDDVTILFFAIHGSERATPRMGFDLAQMIFDDPSLVEEGKRVIIVPIQNPDGFNRGTRRNARNVDLNRNYPTMNWGHQPEGRRIYFGEAPASEPETQATLKLLAQIQPTKIISVHQPLLCNNPDGPAGMGLALLMGQYNNYPLEPYIGFPTPGSFGTYAGQEREIPMVTLELPRGGPYEDIYDEMWRDNYPALLAVVNANLDELPTEPAE